MPAEQVLKKPRIFYGYWIILVAFLCVFIFSGTGTFGFSIFVKPLQTEMGWSRASIMAGLTIVFMIIAATSLFVGRVVDRYGVKQVICFGAVMTAVGFAALSRMASLWHYYASYVAVGVGLSAMGQVPASAVVSRWFKKKRGLAIGIMAAGTGIGGFVLAPVLGGAIIPAFGWRGGYLFLSVFTLLLIIPPTLLVIKERPSDIGLYPDGAAAPETVAGKEISSTPVGGVTLRQALATGTFWLLAVCFFFNQFSQAGVILNQAAHLEDIGYPAAQAAAAVGLVGLGSAIGKFTFGWFCDRMPAKWACAIGLFLQVIGVIIILNIGPTSPTALLWFYALLMGFGVGSWLPTMSMVTSSSFGLAYYGSIFGAISFAQSFGLSLGPLVAGRMYDVLGNYQLAFTIMLLLYAVAIPTVLLTRSVKGYREPSVASEKR